MNYTVSLLLLVAIGLAEPSSRLEEDDYQSAKRDLLEGNYGLRIQPSILIASNVLESQQVDTEKYSQKNTSVYGGPPVVKISDVLTGQGPPIPAEISDHLYSPVSTYQSRLGSFEISPPIPSQLRYAEHKIISDNFQQTLKQNFESLKEPQITITQQNYERQENLRNTNEIFGFSPRPPTITDGKTFENQENHILNFEPQKINQNDDITKQKQLQQDSLRRPNLQNVQNYESAKQTEAQQHEDIWQHRTLPVFSEIRSPHLDLADAFLPRLEQSQPPSRPIYSEQIIQQIFPQIEGFSQDFFQQINELGNQLSPNTVQYFEYSDDEQNNAEEKKEDQKIENDKSSQQVQSTTERQQNTTLAPTSTTGQIHPQAVSYARFSLGLPLTSSDIQSSSQQLVLDQVSPPPQLLPLPQPQPQQLFQPLLQGQMIRPLPQLQLPQLSHPLPQLSPQPIQVTTPQPHLQPIPVQPLFQPLPPQPTQQTLTSAAPLQTLFTVANQTPQRIGVISIRHATTQGIQPTSTTSTQNQQKISTQSQNQDFFTTPQSQFSSSPQITLHSESALVTQANGFPNEDPVLTTNDPPRFRSESSTESPTSTTLVTIVPKLASELSTVPSLSQPSTSPLQAYATSTSSPALPPRPDSEEALSTIPTLIQPLPTSETISESPQQLSHSTTRPSTPSKSHSVQVLTSQQPTLQPWPPLQPFPTLPPLPLLQPMPTLQTFSFPLAPQQLPTIQPFPAAQQSLPTFQPLPIIPQPLPSLQPYLIQPLPQQQIPGISATPIQQAQAQQQHRPLQLVPVQQEYPAQIQLKPTPSPPPQQFQIQAQPHQSQQQSAHAPQSQSQETKQSQYREDQLNELGRNEAAIAHAHQLLYGLYSPFIQRPVYSETQEIEIQPQAASIAYPASYSSHPSLFASPQFFGKYAQDIFGGHLQHYKKK